MIKDFLPPILYRTLSSAWHKVSRDGDTERYDVTENDYNAGKYWDERHKRYGFETLKGVGHCGLSEWKNYAWYVSAR